MATLTRKIELIKPEEKDSTQSPDKASPEVTDFDLVAFDNITSAELTSEQIHRMVNPQEVYPRQNCVLAVHWHPEYVPMDIIRQRIEATFPNKNKELVIPTQHNRIMSYDGRYCGVEVDCYSGGFKRKVQLLLHFRKDRADRANVLKSMLDHTFEYRSGQLFELMDTLTESRWDDYRQLAAEGTGVGENVIRFAMVQTQKLKAILTMQEAAVSLDTMKNRLVRDFMEEQKALYPGSFIHRVQVYVKAVKKIVKQNFSLTYFYRTSEIIEEARHVGCGIIVPHPEQFWPVLLSEYDIDGYEVWNPQSMEYSEFLINVINRQNKYRGSGKRQLLLFMGDDTHMSEKAKEPNQAEASKYYREIGVQPAWEDLSIKKSLIVGNFSRESMMDRYMARLDG